MSIDQYSMQPHTVAKKRGAEIQISDWSNYPAILASSPIKPLETGDIQHLFRHVTPHPLKCLLAPMFWVLVRVEIQGV